MIDTLDHFIISADSLPRIYNKLVTAWDADWEALSGNGWKVCIRKSVVLSFFSFSLKKEKPCMWGDWQTMLSWEWWNLSFFHKNTSFAFLWKSLWKVSLGRQTLKFKCGFQALPQTEKLSGGRDEEAWHLLSSRWCQNNWKNPSDDRNSVFNQLQIGLEPNFLFFLLLKARVHAWSCVCLRNLMVFSQFQGESRKHALAFLVPKSAQIVCFPAARLLLCCRIPAWFPDSLTVWLVFFRDAWRLRQG